MVVEGGYVLGGNTRGGTGSFDGIRGGNGMMGGGRRRRRTLRKGGNKRTTRRRKTFLSRKSK